MSNNNFKQLKMSKTWAFRNPYYSRKFDLYMSGIVRDMDEKPVMLIELQHSPEDTSEEYVVYTFFPIVKFNNEFYKIGKAIFHVIIDEKNFQTHQMERVPNIQESVEYASRLVQRFILSWMDVGDEDVKESEIRKAGNLIFSVKYDGDSCIIKSERNQDELEILSLNFHKLSINQKTFQMHVPAILFQKDKETKIAVLVNKIK